MKHFRCVVIHVKCSQSACAARYRANIDPSCRGCQVGKEHAQGRSPEHWPNGSTIERVEVARAKPTTRMKRSTMTEDQ